MCKENIKLIEEIEKLKAENERLSAENAELKDALNNVKSIRFANLEATVEDAVDDFGGINIYMTLPDGSAVGLAYVEHYRCDDYWHVSTFCDFDDDDATSEDYINYSIRDAMDKAKKDALALNASLDNVTADTDISAISNEIARLASYVIGIRQIRCYKEEI